ncbi:hypothetical protein ACJJTC_016365 [Scirpophaga incertulas]
MLEIIHDGHLGLDRCKRRAREVLFWPGIKSNTDFYLNLLSYHNTPRDNLGSPAQLMMGRRLNCRLPVHPDLLKMNCCNNHYQNLLQKQNKSKYYYDQRCRRQPELDVGDDVIMYEQNNERTRGTITGKFETPRSYIVKNQRGVYRRNRRHLMKTVPEEIQSNESRNIEVCNKNNLQRENDKNKKSVPSDNLQLSDNKYKEDYSPPLTRMRAKKL